MDFDIMHGWGGGYEYIQDLGHHPVLPPVNKPARWKKSTRRGRHSSVQGFERLNMNMNSNMRKTRLENEEKYWLINSLPWSYAEAVRNPNNKQPKQPPASEDSLDEKENASESDQEIGLTEENSCVDAAKCEEGSDVDSELNPDANEFVPSDKDDSDCSAHDDEENSSLENQIDEEPDATSSGDLHTTEEHEQSLMNKEESALDFDTPENDSEDIEDQNLDSDNSQSETVCVDPFEPVDPVLKEDGSNNFADCFVNSIETNDSVLIDINGTNDIIHDDFKCRRVSFANELNFDELVRDKNQYGETETITNNATVESVVTTEQTDVNEPLKNGKKKRSRRNKNGNKCKINNANTPPLQPEEILEAGYIYDSIINNELEGGESFKLSGKFKGLLDKNNDGHCQSKPDLEVCDTSENEVDPENNNEMNYELVNNIQEDQVLLNLPEDCSQTVESSLNNNLDDNEISGIQHNNENIEEKSPDCSEPSQLVPDLYFNESQEEDVEMNTNNDSLTENIISSDCELGESEEKSLSIDSEISNIKLETDQDRVVPSESDIELNENFYSIQKEILLETVQEVPNDKIRTNELDIENNLIQDNAEESKNSPIPIIAVDFTDGSLTEKANVELRSSNSSLENDSSFEIINESDDSQLKNEIEDPVDLTIEVDQIIKSKEMLDIVPQFNKEFECSSPTNKEPVAPEVDSSNPKDILQNQEEDKLVVQDVVDEVIAEASQKPNHSIDNSTILASATSVAVEVTEALIENKKPDVKKEEAKEPTDKAPLPKSTKSPVASTEKKSTADAKSSKVAATKIASKPSSPVSKTKSSPSKSEGVKPAGDKTLAVNAKTSPSKTLSKGPANSTKSSAGSDKAAPIAAKPSTPTSKLPPSTVKPAATKPPGNAVKPAAAKAPPATKSQSKPSAPKPASPTTKSSVPAKPGSPISKSAPVKPSGNKQVASNKPTATPKPSTPTSKAGTNAPKPGTPPAKSAVKPSTPPVKASASKPSSTGPKATTTTSKVSPVKPSTPPAKTAAPAKPTLSSVKAAVVKPGTPPAAKSPVSKTTGTPVKTAPTKPTATAKTSPDKTAAKATTPKAVPKPTTPPTKSAKPAAAKTPAAKAPVKKTEPSQDSVVTSTSKTSPNAANTTELKSKVDITKTAKTPVKSSAKPTPADKTKPASKTDEKKTQVKKATTADKSAKNLEKTTKSLKPSAENEITSTTDESLVNNGNVPLIEEFPAQIIV